MARVLIVTVALLGAVEPDVGGDGRQTPDLQPVRIVVSAAGERTLPGTKERADQAFERVLREKVEERKPFTAAPDGTHRDYDLEIVVFEGEQEHFTDTLEYAYGFRASWRLIDSKSRTVEFQRIVEGRFRAGDFWASKRITHAVEGAIRDNIARGLEALSASGALRR